MLSDFHDLSRDFGEITGEGTGNEARWPRGATEDLTILCNEPRREREQTEQDSQFVSHRRDLFSHRRPRVEPLPDGRNELHAAPDRGKLAGTWHEGERTRERLEVLPVSRIELTGSALSRLIRLELLDRFTRSPVCRGLA